MAKQQEGTRTFLRHHADTELVSTWRYEKAPLTFWALGFATFILIMYF